MHLTCVCGWVYVSVGESAHAHGCVTHARARAHTRTHAHAYTHTHACACALTLCLCHYLSYTHVRTHSNPHTWIRTCWQLQGGGRRQMCSTTTFWRQNFQASRRKDWNVRNRWEVHTRLRTEQRIGRVRTRLFRCPHKTLSMSAQDSFDVRTRLFRTRVMNAIAQQVIDRVQCM